MLNAIIAFSIKNKLIIGLFILGLIGYGSYEVTRLPIDAVPDITDNQVQIITTSPALGAPDIERFITFPIEQANSNIAGLKQIRSFSRFGLSVVTIVFNDDVDIYWARQQVTERLQQVQQQIPVEFGQPALAPITTGLGEIYQYIIRPKKGFEDKYSSADLRTIQDWTVRRQLLGVPGVADVSSFGGHVKQYEVAVNPSKLLANNVTIPEVFDALEKNNQNTGGAYIEKASTVLFIRSEGLVGTIDDIENVVVKSLANGIPLLISDIAEVRIGSAVRYGAMTYNGEGEVSGAVVLMLKGANSSEVILKVKERIALIQKMLPDGVILEPFLDRTKMVNNSIKTVTQNLAEGALIVIFILVLFLGNLRAGFLVASVIPLAMLFAIIMMNTFGVSGNLMSLGALDFGLIVDGAVIIVEAVLHSLAYSKSFEKGAHLSQHQMDREVNGSASRMLNSAVFGQFIILIVYLPIFALEGIEGKMFKPMAQTVAFALVGAFILSLTYIPMMSALLLSKNIPHKKTFSDRLMAWVEHKYERLLERILYFPKTVISLVLALFVFAMFVLTSLGGEFIPSLPEGDFAVETRVLQGSSLKTSTEAVLKSEKILLEKFPEVEKVVGKTGSSEIPTDPMPIEASDLMIILKDKSEWTSADNYNDLADLMAKELAAVPGVTFSFQYPVAMRFNELMTGARQDVVCKIFGEDIDTLAKYAQKLGSISGTVQGSKNIFVEPVSGMPQIVIKYNRKTIAQYGINISDINRAVNTSFAGQSSGLVYEGEKRFDLVVRLIASQRKDLQDVQSLLIPTPNGTHIPLSAVADIAIVNDVNQIQRENTQRRIIVGFNVHARDVKTTVTDLQQKVDQHLKLPTGYYVTYGGAFENLKKATDRLSIAVPVSLLLIFILLYFAFHSVKYGLLIYSAIPLSAIGGILALALRGMPFSISAGVGFIALFGVAVLNGIVLIAEFNRQKGEGITDLKQVVVLSGKMRLRPVLMTAFVASLGFLPMALSSGEGAEVQRPLATVVIGGLIVATFLTLFVLPVLYILFEKVNKPSSASVVSALVLLLFCQQAKAQETIGLNPAIDMAVKNNLSLRSEKLNTEYLELLKGTAYNIPQTNVSMEYGNINSSYNDNRFFISQSIKFPTVYAAQKRLANEEWKNGLLNTSLKENNLKKEVRKVYYEMLFLMEKKKLLRHTDSIYHKFLDNAELRFKKGESNILEKTTAETQRKQIELQLLELENDFSVLQWQFKWLLNTNTMYVPEKTDFKYGFENTIDTAQIEKHPVLLQLKQLQSIHASKLKLEKTKLMPDFMVGYSNMSMYGTGADNVFYGNRSTRFSSVQVGIGVPLFINSQRANIRSGKINLQLSENNYQSGLMSMKIQYRQALESYSKNLQLVTYYENTALKNADLIIVTATKQFSIGELNYLEWVLLANNAISIQTQYIDAVKRLNESVIEINSMTNQ